MLEVVFSDSAAGSLKIAARSGSRIGGGPENGRNLLPPDPAPEALGQLCCLPLALGVGPLAGGPFGPARREALAGLYRFFPQGEEVTDALLARGRQDFETLCRRVGQGEPARIWYSSQPDEACGLCWLLAQLQELPGRGPVRLVALPAWEERPDGTLVQYTGWGELEPEAWAAHLPLQREAPAALLVAAALRWHTLLEENAPLRGAVNGRLQSLPVDFYDHFIRREIETQPEEFLQAVVIGRVLGNYQLGISDGWVALRMEEMIAAGLLEPATQPPADGPRYHRRLRKIAAFPKG